MEFEFADDGLSELYSNRDCSTKLPLEVVKAFRRRMQSIRAAADERDLYAHKSWRFEKLRGDMGGERSIRLNDQWRLIVEIVPTTPKNVIRVMRIEDYH